MGKKYIICVFKQLLKKVLKIVTHPINLIWLLLEKKYIYLKQRVLRLHPDGKPGKFFYTFMIWPI